VAGKGEQLDLPGCGGENRSRVVLRHWHSFGSNTTMPKIFISYRRDDTAFAAQSIYDKLKELFGDESITFDVNFSLGVDFAKKIDESVCRCDVLLAIIGDRGLDLRFADGPMQGQRRLDDPNDWVRLEIASALKRDILVIPVLVGKVSMPDISSGLPPDLADLTKKVAVSVRAGPDLPNDLNYWSGASSEPSDLRR
jgi:hypothetical protein